MLSAAGKEPGREVLNSLEQLRAVLGQVLGKQEMEPVWPIRILVFSSATAAPSGSLLRLRLSRDAWVGAVTKGSSLPMRQLTRIFLESNTSRMPESIENGLLELFSTLKVDGTRVTLGIPVEESRRGRDWARMHLLTVSPAYSGRVRVLFFNLQHGADWTAAYWNAFEKTPAEIEKEVNQYLATGNFPPRQVSGAAISTKDFSPRDFEPVYIAVALADLREGDAARGAYQAIVGKYGGNAAALEGLGRYPEAIQAGSRSARCWLEYGCRLKDPVRAQQAFRRAAELNPRWAEPHVQMAKTAAGLAVKTREWKLAAELAPRNPAYWQALAETYMEQNNFAEAGKAWTNAEHAAPTEAERRRLLSERLAVERQRTEHLAAERKRAREERRREEQKTQEQLAASIRAAEKEAAAKMGGAPVKGKVVEWWDDSRPKSKTSGKLVQVDCLPAGARLVIEKSGAVTIRLLIRDPSQVVILGGGRRNLGCGIQRPSPWVSVEYFDQPDKKLNIAGEVSVIEFR